MRLFRSIFAKLLAPRRVTTSYTRCPYIDQYRLSLDWGGVAIIVSGPPKDGAQKMDKIIERDGYARAADLAKDVPGLRHGVDKSIGQLVIARSSISRWVRGRQDKVAPCGDWRHPGPRELDKRKKGAPGLGHAPDASRASMYSTIACSQTSPGVYVPQRADLIVGSATSGASRLRCWFVVDDSTKPAEERRQESDQESPSGKPGHLGFHRPPTGQCGRSSRSGAETICHLFSQAKPKTGGQDRGAFLLQISCSILYVMDMG